MTTINEPASKDGSTRLPVGAVTFEPERQNQVNRLSTGQAQANVRPYPPLSGIKPNIKDSGTREKFDTGAVRDTRTGKGRFDLLPFEGLERVAQTFEDGCMKYGENNWLLGMPVSRFLDSALRHAYKYLAGHADEDHLSMATWNLLAALTVEERAQRGVLPRELLLESRQKYVGHPDAG